MNITSLLAAFLTTPRISIPPGVTLHTITLPTITVTGDVAGLSDLRSSTVVTAATPPKQTVNSTTILTSTLNPIGIPIPTVTVTTLVRARDVVSTPNDDDEPYSSMDGFEDENEDAVITTSGSIASAESTTFSTSASSKKTFMTGASFANNTTNPVNSHLATSTSGGISHSTSSFATELSGNFCPSARTVYRTKYFTHTTCSPKLASTHRMHTPAGHHEASQATPLSRFEPMPGLVVEIYTTNLSPTGGSTNTNTVSGTHLPTPATVQSTRRGSPPHDQSQASAIGADQTLTIQPLPTSSSSTSCSSSDLRTTVPGVPTPPRNDPTSSSQAPDPSHFAQALTTTAIKPNIPYGHPPDLRSLPVRSNSSSPPPNLPQAGISTNLQNPSQPTPPPPPTTFNPKPLWGDPSLSPPAASNNQAAPTSTSNPTLTGSPTMLQPKLPLSNACTTTFHYATTHPCTSTVFARTTTFGANCWGCVGAQPPAFPPPGEICEGQRTTVREEVSTLSTCLPSETMTGMEMGIGGSSGFATAAASVRLGSVPGPPRGGWNGSGEGQ